MDLGPDHSDRNRGRIGRHLAALALAAVSFALPPAMAQAPGSDDANLAWRWEVAGGRPFARAPFEPSHGVQDALAPIVAELFFGGLPAVVAPPVARKRRPQRVATAAA